MEENLPSVISKDPERAPESHEGSRFGCDSGSPVSHQSEYWREQRAIEVAQHDVTKRRFCLELVEDFGSRKGAAGAADLAEVFSEQRGELRLILSDGVGEQGLLTVSQVIADIPIDPLLKV